MAEGFDLERSIFRPVERAPVVGRPAANLGRLLNWEVTKRFGNEAAQKSAAQGVFNRREALEYVDHRVVDIMAKEVTYSETALSALCEQARLVLQHFDTPEIENHVPTLKSLIQEVPTHVTWAWETVGLSEEEATKLRSII